MSESEKLALAVEKGTAKNVSTKKWSDLNETQQEILMGTPGTAGEAVGFATPAPEAPTLDQATIETKEPIKVYRAEDAKTGITTYVSGTYYATTEAFAKRYGEVITESAIPAGARVFDFDVIKGDMNQTVIPADILIDPDQTRQYLLDMGYQYTKNTNVSGVEYVQLDNTRLAGNDRWTYDPSAQPGEDMYFLDGTDTESAKAVISEADQRKLPWGAFDKDGVMIGRFKTLEQAQRAAEKRYPGPGDILKAYKWDKMPLDKRVALTAKVGLPEAIASKKWQSLSLDVQDALNEGKVLAFEKETHGKYECMYDEEGRLIACV
jgi:hypothetical protein